jgi:ABC-type branched-subunit amino acid transport system substrate-binding protein
VVRHPEGRHAGRRRRIGHRAGRRGSRQARNKIALLSGPGTSRLTNENCTPVSVHYAWDTYALAAVTGRGVVKGGGDTWFFLTADYAFGHSLEKDATDVVKAEGGKWSAASATR